MENTLASPFDSSLSIHECISLGSTDLCLLDGLKTGLLLQVALQSPLDCDLSGVAEALADEHKGVKVIEISQPSP